MSTTSTQSSVFEKDKGRKPVRNNLSQHQNSSNMMKDESITDTDDEPRFKSHQ